MPARRGLRRRGGVVLICVIVCMAVAAWLLGGMLKSSLLTRRQLREERQLRQTEWLVQAGAQRAAFLLARDPDYAGETWSLSAESVAGTEPAEITIAVTRDVETARVSITAEYPAGDIRSVRRSREFLMDTDQPYPTNSNLDGE